MESHYSTILTIVLVKDGEFSLNDARDMTHPKVGWLFGLQYKDTVPIARRRAFLEQADALGVKIE
jgi:hypothetical protein